MEKETFELNLSQEVSLLQTKYTLYKQVINILSAMSYDEEFDKELMTKAINEAIKRNDCMRIKFFKESGKVRQYFVDELEVKDIKQLSFVSKLDFDKWYKDYRKKPIKYLKGVSFEISFIENYDGTHLIFFKVCHMILDIYGINVLFNDINGIYLALKKGTEYPKAPGEFKQVLINDIKVKNDQERINNNEDFFKHYLDEKQEPTYACVTGNKEGIWARRYKKGKNSQKMFFLKCDTTPHALSIDSKTVGKVINYATENKISIANIFFYVYNITSSLLNGYCEHMLPLELSNCRGTIAEKKCAGTKVQSVGCYTEVKYDQNFDSQMKHYSELQAIQYKHLGFSDTAFELMLHKHFKSSLLTTYYHICFSLIPYEENGDYKLKIYSNGKGALGCYLAMMLDTKTNKITVCYDLQDKIGKEKQIRRFHEKYIEVLNKLMDNPNLKLEELK